MTYEDKLLQAFVGKENNAAKLQWYKEAFKKFENGGKWKWSWWAFFFPVSFSFYRKDYLGGLILFGGLIAIVFIAGIIGSMASAKLGSTLAGILSILAFFISGGFSIYSIYRRFKKKKADVESVWEDEEDKIRAMKSVGGYSKVFLAIFVIYILSKILITLIDKDLLVNVSGTPNCSNPEVTTLVKQLVEQNPIIDLYAKGEEAKLEMIRTVSHDKDLDRYICKAKLNFEQDASTNDMVQNIMLQALSNVKYSVGMMDDNKQFVVEILNDDAGTNYSYND